MPMSDDLAWFEANRPSLARSYPDMFVIVKDQAVVAAYPDYASAYAAAVAMFGTEKFVLKEATPSQVHEQIVPSLRGPLMRTQPLMRSTDLRMRLGQAAQQQYAQDVAERLRETGAIIDVTIGIPEALADQLSAQGQNVPPPQTVKGMVDTGASISTVSDAVAAAAGLQQIGSVPIGGVGGTSERPIVSASFMLPDYGNLTVDPLQVAVVTVPAPGFEILIGRDLLKALHLDYQGPAGLFNLTQGAAGAGGAQAASGGLPKWVPVVGGVAAVGLIALFAFDVL